MSSIDINFLFVLLGGISVVWVNRGTFLKRVQGNQDWMPLGNMHRKEAGARIKEREIYSEGPLGRVPGPFHLFSLFQTAKNKSLTNH